MKSRKELITNGEVIGFIPFLSTGFQVCNVAEAGAMIRAEFNDCLGMAFYDLLISQLNCYDYEKYNPETTYNEGDVVGYKGVIYVNVKPSTNVIPSQNDCWKLAPKFKEGECVTVDETIGYDKNGEPIIKETEVCTCDYNDFFCDYLGPYLSYVILRNRLPIIRVRITNDGIMTSNSQSLTSASKDAYSTLRISIDDTISCLFDDMVRYMKENPECFGLFKGIATDCCGGCGCLEESCKCPDDCSEVKANANEYEIG